MAKLIIELTEDINFNEAQSVIGAIIKRNKEVIKNYTFEF